MINRLRHNVIKAGLRKINVAYARISIADICEKLKLEDKQDAEYIVAKAIRDGVIDATLDHAAQELRSNENQDIYATTEPQELYHKRIQFCLNIHNEAVQAMSYPDDSVAGKDGKESVSRPCPCPCPPIAVCHCQRLSPGLSLVCGGFPADGRMATAVWRCRRRIG